MSYLRMAFNKIVKTGINDILGRFNISSVRYLTADNNEQTESTTDIKNGTKWIFMHPI